MAGGLIQAVVGDLREGEGTQAADAQGNIQIPQADITVDTQHLLAASCKSLRDTGTQRRFTRPALAGHNGDQFTQTQALLAS